MTPTINYGSQPDLVRASLNLSPVRADRQYEASSKPKAGGK